LFRWHCVLTTTQQQCTDALDQQLIGHQTHHDVLIGHPVSHEHTDTYIPKDRQIDRRTNRHTDRQTEADRQRQTDRDRQTETDRDRQRQTDRHTDRQTDRQTDGQTDRETRWSHRLYYLAINRLS